MESVEARELKGWIDAKRDMVVLDSRTLEEFTRMSIPSGISVPGGELAYRVGDIVPDPKTLIVVNCAGQWARQWTRVSRHHHAGDHSQSEWQLWFQ